MGARRTNEIVLFLRRAEKLTQRSEEHTSELQSPDHLVCRLLLEKKKKNKQKTESELKETYTIQYKNQQDQHISISSDSPMYLTQYSISIYTVRNDLSISFFFF